MKAAASPEWIAIPGRFPIDAEEREERPNRKVGRRGNKKRGREERGRER